MKILIDSREQVPFTFEHERYECTTKQDNSYIGDYSLVGLQDKVAVERKSLPDLVQCLGRERGRFEKELLRGQALDAFAVVVESPWSDLTNGNYRSQLNPHAACQSVLAFMGRYKVPFLFTAGRTAAEYATWGFLRQYLEGQKSDLRPLPRQKNNNNL